MKPFIALAASAPFLLLAGVGHAATFSFSDENCSSFTFNSTTGVITCVPAAPQGQTPPPAEPTPPPAEPTPPPAEPTPPPPSASSCPTTPPAGTVVINIGGRDNYANKDFDVVFDNPGSTLDTAMAAGQSKAFQFTNGKSRAGYLSSAPGGYANGYKDWAVSLCPGDFTNNVLDKCVASRRTTVNLGYSTDGSLGCTIPLNTPVYLNVRGTNGIAAGFVIQNLQTVAQ